MEIPESLIEFIKDEACRVTHGKIIIEINETAKKIDVITEARTRFIDKGVARK